jgi:GT2 family glycosyltransferase
MPTLSIILVNYKRAHDTIECVRSLRQGSYQDFEIIIVDNGSEDGSLEKLRAACVDTTILPSRENLGFAEGNNLGIRKALQSESKFLLLLNNDTVVSDEVLYHLLQTMETHPEAGIVGGKILYYDRPKRLWFAGGFFNPDSALGGHWGIDEEDAGEYDVPRRCDYISGCCLMFRRSVVERIGMLESAYFAYLEDVEFCLRAGRAGFAVMYQPAAVIYHKISTTSAWDSPLYIYFNLRNKLLFLRRNSRPQRWLPHLPSIVFYYVRQFARLLVKWRDLPAARAALWGVVDGLRGYTGEHGRGRLERVIHLRPRRLINEIVK